MDLITQMHNYVGYLAGYMASTLDHINQHAPPCFPPSLSQPATAATATTATAASTSSSPAPPSSPPAPQPESAFSASVSDRAQQLYKRLSELRTLAECLPAEMASEDEQLRVLAELNAASEAEQRRLEEAEAEARLWQARLSSALQEAAAAQLNIHTQAGSAGNRKGAHQRKTRKRSNRRLEMRKASSVAYEMSASSPLSASSPANVGMLE